MNPRDSTLRARARQRSGARTIRRLLGADEVDALFGATTADECVDRLLTYVPDHDRDRTDDGASLLGYRHSTTPAGPWASRAEVVVSKTAGLLWMIAVVMTAVWFAVATTNRLMGVGSDDLAETLAWWVLLPAAVILLVSIGLQFVARVLRQVGVLADGRLVVRWAQSRPGQAERGLPSSSPFHGPHDFGIYCAVVWWFVVFLLAISYVVYLNGEGWELGSDGDGSFNRGLALFILGVAVVAYLISWAAARLGRADVAAGHLFAFERQLGAPFDDITTQHSASLLAVEAASGRISERTIFPGTTGLPPADLERRRTHFRAAGVGRWVGPEDGPIVTLHTPNAGYASGSVLKRYRSGWHVADARLRTSPVELWIPDDDPTTASDTLATFGDHTGLDAGSVVPRETPVPVADKELLQRHRRADETP